MAQNIDTTPYPRKEIVFYDGDCSMCNWLVRFIVKRDSKGHFYHAPLHGRTCQEVLPDLPQSLDSIVLYNMRTQKYRVRSAAVFSILSRLNSPWGILGRVLQIIPPLLADPIYRLVAAMRQWLSKCFPSACELPPPHLKERLLP